MTTLNPFKAIKEYFEKRERKWIARLISLGFDKVTFPIIVKDGFDLDVIYQLRDFAIDPDWYYHEFTQQMEFIDSKGQLWTWKYDNVNKTNLPGTVKRILTFDEVKKIINDYFKNSKIEQEIQDQTTGASTIDQLIDIIADRL